ncbi:uncharacterized protein LTR77_009009 [Saxophila tyrrhenica]|uniref:DDHD domain-containing protein n=1 Tax=Saxophila tyrrhenica TaxID=1690608 RepID=A0AAV9P079_9PEZI|nr:hypothetical protein LTR77_009009 [Saxophila tyrrhenica]
MAGANQYIRQVLHHTEPPPPVNARFFYSSPIPIDDPLSPLPPPTTATASAKRPPKAFSEYDNAALDKAWHDLRRKILKYNEEQGEKSGSNDGSRSRAGSTNIQGSRRGSGSQPATPRSKPIRLPASSLSQVEGLGDGTSEGSAFGEATHVPDTTGNPFVRAPSRKQTVTTSRNERPARPQVKQHDTYDWDDDSHLLDQNATAAETKDVRPSSAPSNKVAVGVSRLHQVEMPNLQMTPIYWTPVHDEAAVIRGTWFYQETMLPVETAVANMLEAGYVDLQVWTETWKDELNSAVEVGAVGEEKIVHKLWPDKLPKPPDSRPSSRHGTATRSDRDDLLRAVTSNLAEGAPETPEQTRDRAVEAACDIIDISSGPGGADNKASGTSTYGYNGATRSYSSFGVIYANAKEARLLKPSLLPSRYYGRRPLASYIRKGHKLGIAVVRGFDQRIWNKIHPSKSSPRAAKAQQGAATSASNVPPQAQAKDDVPDENTNVTDLIFVIHGIGQQLSHRMESFHFTHAINAFRREVNVEVGSKEVRARFRRDMGGIMVLPINWRHSLSFEEGGYRDGSENPARNEFTLADITPETLPSVRGIVNDVMSDIPYYLSHHQPKMMAAVIREANRVYQLWCRNNPGFADTGRVHLIAHSLGSIMALDILSNQPTKVPQHLSDPTSIDLDAEQLDHFLFQTSNIYNVGSPAGFFLLLKQSQLLPRVEGPSATAMDDPIANTLTVCGERAQYGCPAVDNVYNIINPYDPVAYRMNAAVDATYSATLKQAFVPSATPGWFGVGTKSSSIWGGSTTAPKDGAQMPTLPRLPSNVEMEVHNFSREEIAEKRMALLNDNGQVDFFLSVGITEPIYGPSAIQSVADQAKEKPYTELNKDDLRWECMDSTNVETKSFYMLSDDGRVGMAQVIYSNVLGVRTTAQFTSKIFSQDPSKPHAWSSTNLSNLQFPNDKHDFTADNCSITISEKGTSYHIKSNADAKHIVDLKFTQACPGLVVGKDGTSYFGTDPQKYWGRMIHKFWPRCQVEGQILRSDGPVDFKGKGMFVHALQGMKPHFAAAKWNFANFHSPNVSASLMNYTTPPSYGETPVTVGSVTKDGQILFTGASPDTKPEHTETRSDPDSDWPEPAAVRFTWVGKTADGKDAKAVIEGSLGERADRIDVMGELPKFVKSIVQGASGVKAYIYQYTPKMTLKLDVGGEVTEEEGLLFSEATFIS